MATKEKKLLSVCKGCRARIEWIKTIEGNNMPVDPGIVVIVTKQGETKRGQIPHWHTCPESKMFKK